VASLEGIDSGASLGKYRVEERLAGDERAYFSALSEDGQRLVNLMELRGEEVDSYAAAARQNPDHAHLADVLEVIEHEGTSLLVFESVGGTTLTARLAEIGKKTEVEAVGAALRISDALSNLHEAGGVHGFIHTDSVMLEPPDRLGPVLTFAPIPSDERTFHSPERGETGKPSVADDAWATAGLLHMMLTATAPPKEGYGSLQELTEAGVAHPALREALLHGLNRDAAKRGQDVRPLKRELARWFVEHASEEAAFVGPHSTMPPPLPGSASSRPLDRTQLNVVAAKVAPPPPRRSRFTMMAVVGTLVGLGAAWGLSSLRAAPPPPPPAPPPAPAAPASAKAIDLLDVPVTGQEQKQTVELDKAASCVASYLPKGAFGKSPDLGWLCTETDPNKGATQLRVAVVGSAPKGTLSDAMKLFAKLGWYDMAAFAVVRAGCCEDPKPLVTPEPGKGCDSLGEALRDIAKEVIAGRNYEEAFKRYTGGIHCEFNLGHGANYGRGQRPQPGEDTAFKEFVEATRH
jgi:serine/threonine protein kinase